MTFGIMRGYVFHDHILADRIFIADVKDESVIGCGYASYFISLLEEN